MIVVSVNTNIMSKHFFGGRGGVLFVQNWTYILLGLRSVGSRALLTNITPSESLFLNVFRGRKSYFANILQVTPFHPSINTSIQFLEVITHVRKSTVDPHCFKQQQR